MINAHLVAAAVLKSPAPTAVTQDTPTDATHRATIMAVPISVLYMAAGAAPYLAVLLLHGFPGNEQNLDLAGPDGTC